MSMTIRAVINALMDAKHLDQECVIEVNRSVFDNTDDDTTWVDVDVEKVINCAWGSVIEGKEYKKE